MAQIKTDSQKLEKAVMFLNVTLLILSPSLFTPIPSTIGLHPLLHPPLLSPHLHPCLLHRGQGAPPAKVSKKSIH